MAAALGALASWGCASTPSPAATTPVQPAPIAHPVAPAAPPETDASPPAPPAPTAQPAPATGPAAASPEQRRAAAKQDFAAEMAAHGLASAQVSAWLGQARYSETVARLVLPPASPTLRSWPRYRARFVESKRIKEGMDFLQRHAATLARADERYGVPPSVIVSVIGVETFYGRVTGNFRIIDALATLAFDYPAQARSDRGPFFRDQLAQFLIWCQETGTDPLAVKGSYAGAIGLPQFMPGSLRNYAVDGNGDGHVDLLGSPEDAIFSVANFLVRHGWQAGQPVFLPVRLPGDPAALVDGGLKPTLNWQQLREAGARPPAVPGMADTWMSWPLAVIDLYDGATGTTEYRVAAPNFFALTEYNRSYFYATAVTDLAVELEKSRPPRTR
ncbi:lytic murein transglycosylase B [Pigmentiphaga humi]